MQAHQVATPSLMCRVEIEESPRDLGPLVAGSIGNRECAPEHHVQPVVQRVALGIHPDLECRVDSFEIGEQRVGKTLGVEQSRMHTALCSMLHHRVEVGDDLRASQREDPPARV